MAYSIDKNDLQNKNPWWQNGGKHLIDKAFMRRDLYFTLEKDLEMPMILNILGLRRTGKSTIVKQLIARLLSQNVKPNNLFYYLFDDYANINIRENLEAVLDFYLENILEKKIYELEDRAYIFLDEIQYTKDWQPVLKKYYDLSGKKIKFVITGSQSILLRKKSAETLAGRIFDYYLPPLSFMEFLKAKNISFLDDILKIETDLFSIEENFKLLETVKYSHKQKLFDLLKEYILSGQFPECLDIEDPEKKNIYLKESVIGKVAEDIMAIYDIDKKENFKILANYLFVNSASLLELKNIAEKIGLSSISLDKYFDYMKSGYLFKVLYRQHKTLIKRGRMLKKNYATSSNFIAAIRNYQLRHFEEVPEVFGHIIETAVYNFLDKNYSGDSLADEISFWRQGEKEIDFIITKNKKQLPIEVKFANAVNAKELLPLLNYIDKKKTGFGIVVTKNELSKKEISGKTIFFVPVFLFLLLNKPR